jgi:UDP-glucose 6-dehydrogenase
MAVLGIAFKRDRRHPRTRASKLIRDVTERGATVAAYTAGMENAKKKLPRASASPRPVRLRERGRLRGTRDGLEQFRKLDLDRLERHEGEELVDLRNLYEPKEMRKQAGTLGLGRM